MTIRVHGEVYDDAAEMVDVIGRLTAEAAQMPDGSPQRHDLEHHIERLTDALPEVPGVARPGGASAVRLDAEAEAEPGNNDEPEQKHGDEDETDEEVTVNVCPTCGQVWPFGDEPNADPYSEQCAACQGWGIVLTGSKVEGHEARTCPRCEGSGYIPKPVPPQEQKVAKAMPTPELAGSLFDPVTEMWNPPPGTDAPWAGATWDGFYGKWV